MCGIIGQINKERPIERATFERMRDTMEHRGPDGKGVYFTKQSKVALGHRRLSIQDLSENGAQPMANQNGNVRIIFNGEIYNFNELREALEVKYTFRSQTDTEVLVHGYEEWGISGLLQKVNGMFAFALLDEEKDKLYLVRDRVGIKPLVYYQNNHTIIFASEIKAIIAYPAFKKQISQQAIADYLMYRYIPAPRTIYRQVSKLLPAHLLEIDLVTLETKKQKYWEIQQRGTNQESEEVLEQKSLALLDKAVKKRLISDVDVQTFLSGGIDSSMISALAAKHSPNIKAYSIEVKDSIKNEIEDAIKVAKFLDVSLDYDSISPSIFHKLHKKVNRLYDEPHGDTSNIPMYLLCKRVSDAGFKVALSGDGGDELFYGYDWYERFIKQCSNTPNSYACYKQEAFNTFSQEQVQGLLKASTKLEKKDFFKEKLNKTKLNKEDVHYLDFLTFLVDDILVKVDIASMANSLEVRVPFLDHLLAEFMYDIPQETLFKKSETKYLLKKIAGPYLPKNTIYKQKQGFSVPSISWLKVNYHRELVHGRLVYDGLFDKSALLKIFSQKIHEEHKWLLYVLELWYRDNIPWEKGLINKALYQLHYTVRVFLPYYYDKVRNLIRN